MTGSNPARVNAVLLGALLFAQLLLMAGSVRRLDEAGAIEAGVQHASAPWLGAARTVGDAVSGAIGVFGDVRRVRRDNVELREQIDRLKTESERGRERDLENARLRRLLGMRDDMMPRAVGASVVAASTSGQSRVLVIAAGKRDGVHADLPVAAWGGAVGRVVEADADYAKLRTLNDPLCRVAGVVQRSRVEGIVAGHGDGPLEMTYVPKYADVAVGDRVVTSGLDGVFPRGLGIGRVTFVGAPAGVSKVIQIEPEVDFAALGEVLVLLTPQVSALVEGGEPVGRP